MEEHMSHKFPRRNFCLGSLSAAVAAQQMPAPGAQHENTASAEPPKELFRTARPVWPRGRETEKNLFAGFRAVFDLPASREAVLRIVASTVYRVFVNGRFRGYGPARGPHGYYRVDHLDLTSGLVAGRNLVAIEVAGYNVNTYDVLDQPSFLQAEIEVDGQVVASTAGSGKRFEAGILKCRVEKVQRYSFQRPFIEIYRMDPSSEDWRGNAAAPFETVACEALAAKNLIPRRAPYPDYALRQPARHVAKGDLETGVAVARLWKDRSLTMIGSKFFGYPESELAEIPSLDLQKVASRNVTAIDKAYAWEDAIALGTNQFHIFDFGTNLSGFFGARVAVSKPVRLYFTFDEILRNGDVDFKRLGCVNAVEYHLAPGTYELECFEPYTLKVLKAMVLEGECSLDHVYLREYVNPDVWKAHFSASDSGLNRLFAAGRETYRQNAVDLFTDCPSRERGGWLCDSYFTGRVEPWLSGHNNVEKAFLENFLLPDKFAHLPEGMLPMCYPADHNNGQFIPNWALWFVLELEEYLGRSNDQRIVDAARPRVTRLFEYFKRFRNSDGLLEKLESWVFIEWSKANDFVQDVNYPSNMLYAAALAAAGRMYGVPEWRDEAGKVRDVIRRQSFDGEFFVDNALRRNGVLTPTHNRTETCQYYAFYLDTATPETHGKLWEILRDKFGPARKEKGLYPEIYPANSFIGNVLRLELLSRAALSRQIVEETRAYLLYMADRTGTLWENVGDYASLNHGFASHVVNVLYRDVLGLNRVDAVRKTVHLRFTDTSLAWCEGRVPVPGGAVLLRWEKENGAIAYKLEAPAGYAVTVDNHSGAPLSEKA